MRALSPEQVDAVFDRFGDANARGSRKQIHLERLNLAQYDTEPISPREWGVLDRFPKRNVALLSGHGGVGKSLLLLQLAVAHVLGKDWLYSLPEQGPVLLVNCEDEGDELCRRLQPILSHFGARFADVAQDLHIFPLAEMQDHDHGTGQLLATVGRDGIVRPTALYAELLAKARAVNPICIVIDNVADVFGGNEIDRVQVRQFIGLMRQLARAANGYVILSAHPSLQGIATRTGLSGSTQWHNSVRGRAYLRGPDDKEKQNGDVPGSDTRVLEFMKSNYSRLAEQIELRWANGLYLPLRTPSAPEQAAANAAADALLLELLDKHSRAGANVSGNVTANNYAPRVFAQAKEAKQAGMGKQTFANALSRLAEAGKIVAETYGAPSRAAQRLVHRRWS
jgi:RecA-family ATPase